MLDLETIRHEKEKTYRTACMLVGGLFWAWIIYSIVSLFKADSLTFFVSVLVTIGGIVFFLWILELISRSMIFSHGVRIGPRQYSECYQICVQVAADFGLEKMPAVFIVQGGGMLNAFAMKFISGRNMVLLYGEIVDQLISRGSYAELRMVVGHEFAHIAFRHINYLLNLLMLPAWIIPFLHSALSRAQELSADRAGMIETGEITAATRALLGVAHGSQCLADKVDPNAFMEQDNDVPYFIGWVVRILAPHPVMTRRIIELANFSEQHPGMLKIKEKVVDSKLAHLVIGEIQMKGSREIGAGTLAETKMPVNPLQSVEFHNSFDQGPAPVVLGVTGYHAGHLFPLRGRAAVIGRDPATSNVVFPMDMTGISRTHCVISFDSVNGTFLIDDRSSHGTFLMNGQRITAGQAMRIKSKDRFYLGDPSVVFEVDIR